jgi:predicted RNase H-like nuclease
VDGAALSSKRRGWIAVAIDDEGFVAAAFYDAFHEVLAAHPAPAILGVDVPIGLAGDAGREADRAARAVLAGRGSSVFAAPVRATLTAATYVEACALSQAACGRKLSRQTWALVARIRELDDHRADERIFEVHPEVSFQKLAGGPLRDSKKSWGGHAARRRALERAGIALPDDLGPTSAVVADDVLDAAAAAWTARRIAKREAEPLPKDVHEHDGGRRIAIWV